MKISKADRRRLQKQVAKATAAAAARYHALPPEEKARHMARAIAGRARWHARKYGLPEPVIQTFDGTLTPGKGVTQTSPLRDFDL